MGLEIQVHANTAYGMQGRSSGEPVNARRRAGVKAKQEQRGIKNRSEDQRREWMLRLIAVGRVSSAC